MRVSINIKEKARQLKNKLAALFLAYKRKDTPLVAKALAAITVAYALSPIDLIPDFIPVLGYLDDIIILPVLIALCLKLIPSQIMRECEEQAAEVWASGKPNKWYFAIPVVVLWLLIIGVIAYKVFFS